MNTSPADRHLIRDEDKKMDVILGYVLFHTFNGLREATFTEQFPGLGSNASNQHGLVVFGYPDQVRMNGKNTMRSMTIIAHEQKVKQEMLKLPAKAGGLNPPKVGQ